MDKILYFNELYKYYGKFLTENENEIFTLYYEENLSMQEIADYKSISKSAVGKSLKTSENKLMEYEGIIRLVEKVKKIKELNIDELLKTKIIEIIEID